MKNIASLLFSWCRHLLSRLVRGWLGGFALTVVVAGIWVAIAVHTEAAIRLSGLFFQLLGIVAAAIGIRDTRRMFGKPSFLQLLRNWAAALPRFKSKVQNISGSASLSFTSSASATVWHGTAPSASLEERFAAMDANLRDVEIRVRKTENSISNNERVFNDKLLKESTERVRQDRELHVLIEAASTDGLHLAAAGAFWLAIGVVLSTASNEILWFAGNV